MLDRSGSAPHPAMMQIAASILAGSLLVAASIALIFRWEVTPINGTVAANGAFRLDRWTGEIVACNGGVDQRMAGLQGAHAYRLECEPWEPPADDFSTTEKPAQ